MPFIGYLGPLDSAQQIIASGMRRLANSPVQERVVALSQVVEIVNDRFDIMLANVTRCALHGKPSSLVKTDNPLRKGGFGNHFGARLALYYPSRGAAPPSFNTGRRINALDDRSLLRAPLC